MEAIEARVLSARATDALATALMAEVEAQKARLEASSNASRAAQEAHTAHDALLGARAIWKSSLRNALAATTQAGTIEPSVTLTHEESARSD